MAVFGASADTAAEGKPRPVLAPHYGDTLFHFYQDKYFSAVTGLMVSQHFQRMSPHDDDSEILRGGLLLSYGMHREAGQIFAQLIERGAPPSVRDRAWYFLAKIRWQRGLTGEAEEAIARIGGKLPAPLEEDRGLLQANLQMARGEFAGAADTLRAMTQDAKNPSQASYYARYNLGVALVKSGDVAGGSALLDEVGRMPSATEEQRSLRDRANVALGFAALQDSRPEAARAVLERVRLESLHANRALLGFGWAAAAAKQHEQALVPWTELAGRSVSDAAVLEAKIALPYAYAELGAYGQALEGYESAVSQFDSERGALDESIAAIRSGKLVEGLNAKNPGEEMGWFWSLTELPEMPHAGHLTQVLAQHEFQEAFKNYRDLLFLGRNLSQWRDSLGAYRDMLAERRASFALRLPQIRTGAQGTAAALAELKQTRASLAAELDRVESQTDVVAFADARQDDLLQRLASVQAAMQAHAKDPEIAPLGDKVRLLSGVLAWQLAQDYPSRLWAARKAMRDADEHLAQAEGREAALAKAQQDEPARFDAFAKRIDALEAQLAALIPRVAGLTQEQQHAVEGIAVAELTRAQQRLAEYQTQARFALAQLYDRANVAANSQGAGDAPRR
ncbi:MAG: hypothetical protein OEU94_07390 [Aquincola sp.]|nr:hypothetical protein [Aquincola sp.]MDH5330627.1 hypothetical protein [Aquincola sp.]